MNKSRFKIIVGFSLIWMFGCTAIIVFYPMDLPQILSDYQFYQVDKSFTTPYDWSMLVVLIVSLVSHVGLLFIKIWARAVFAITNIILITGPLAGEAVVYSQFESFSNDLDILFVGVIVALAYFSNVSKEFS